MLEFLTKFVERYYVDPVRLGTGYNFVNSTTYALLFIGAIYLLFLFLNKAKIRVDKRFAIAIFPYVALGSLVRVLEDAKILTGYFLVTPMIWAIFIFGVFLLLFISRFIERKFRVPYFKTMFLFSIILISIPVSMLYFKNFYGMFLVLLFLSPWIIASYLVKWNIGNKLVSLAHIFDATVSVVAVTSFGFFEEYPIPRFLSGINPFLYIIVKAAVVIGSIVLIDKFSKDKWFNNYLKIIIGVLGFGPGLRNFVSLLVLA
jgi:uncharacterized membrane protein